VTSNWRVLKWFSTGNFAPVESVNGIEGCAHALLTVVKILSTADLSFIQRFCLVCKLVFSSFCSFQ